MKRSLTVSLAIAAVSISACIKNPSEPKPQDPSPAPCVKGAYDSTLICTTQYEPVCGCDNVTYGNACEAKRRGVPSWTEGECSE